MIRQTYCFDIITPCFCGGAEPEQSAEIRAASIRGQLRWWFRVLGGFKSGLSESTIFGAIAGDEGRAGLLKLQVGKPVKSGPAGRKNSEDLNAGMNTDLGYALFPLRPFQDNDGKRGVLNERTGFSLILTWRGSSNDWQNLLSLVVVWANLGAMGFRSRRAIGAIRMKEAPQQLSEALQVFRSQIDVREIVTVNPQTWRETSGVLLKWYRSWRQHGQMNRRWNKQQQMWIQIAEDQKQANRNQPGFGYARRDHNEGLSVQGTAPPNPDPENPHGGHGETYRPTLGLPIIQFFSSLGGPKGPISHAKATVNWEFERDGGRFASPVILRPHQDAEGKWRALVIFVDAKKWPAGKQVYLNGIPRTVSMDLYNTMKADRILTQFP